jgi:hypothetical protein
MLVKGLKEIIITKSTLTPTGKIKVLVKKWLVIKLQNSDIYYLIHYDHIFICNMKKINR